MTRLNNMREGGKNTSHYIKQKNPQLLIVKYIDKISAATLVMSVSPKKTSNAVLCVKREASITVYIMYR